MRHSLRLWWAAIRRPLSGPSSCYFENMGKRLYLLRSGRARVCALPKLTQNLILANLMQAFSEGMVLAAKEWGGSCP